VVSAQRGLLQEHSAHWERKNQEQLDLQLDSIRLLFGELRTDLLEGRHDGASREHLFGEPRTDALEGRHDGRGAAVVQKWAELQTLDEELTKEFDQPSKSNGSVAARADLPRLPSGDAPLCAEEGCTGGLPNSPACKLTSVEMVIDEKSARCSFCEKTANGSRGTLTPSMCACDTPYILKQLARQAKKHVEPPEGSFGTPKKRKGTGVQAAEHDGKDFMLRITNHWTFKACSASLILLNTLFTGWQVDVNVQRAFETPMREVPEFFAVIDIVFCAAFTLELAFRMGAYRRDFFFGQDWRWNMFDFVLVSSQYGEYALGSFIDMSAVRVLRIMNLARTLRIIKVVPFFKKLRMMVVCIVNSLMSLFWSLVFLFLVMYLFSITCLQATINYQRGDGNLNLDPSNGDDMEADELTVTLKKHFRSLPRALFAMLMTITGGMDWYDIIQPLLCLHWAYGLMFAIWISFVLFGVLNVLSAVFVEQAMNIRDRDLLIQSEMEECDDFVSDMSDLFREADFNGNGCLTQDELGKYLKNERVVAYMKGYDLDISDFPTIFSLMDQDASGSIAQDEFVIGMMKLKGKARCLDVMRLFQCLDVLQSHLSEIEMRLPEMCIRCGSDPREISGRSFFADQQKKQNEGGVSQHAAHLLPGLPIGLAVAVASGLEELEASPLAGSRA